jgi:hypothetical protein
MVIKQKSFQSAPMKSQSSMHRLAKMWPRKQVFLSLTCGLSFNRHKTGSRLISGWYMNDPDCWKGNMSGLA